MTVRVLLADDQADVRGGFRIILDAQPDLEVVGEAADGEEAVRLAEELRPDVVVADIRMPKLDGLELTRLLAGPAVADPVPVLVVTTFDLDEYVFAALRNGACGFLLKRSGPALLVEGVRAAVAGDAMISPAVTTRLLRELTPRTTRTAHLTDREEEVIRLVALGRTNAEIAAELVISPGTAKTHVANLHTKLDARNRVELAAWAWETGRMRER
ncbi:LuxR family two component transcriptional regulator [Kribbella amoyensis]|uniref:LuxR family two component transcriptional regulator n=1 Tax=Kribbella amoyensis TaxID=996641 RepID=A0A561BRE7_9ACTN|nr:response regulator transcription factor [Kribbella amoyensis]TWD81419.1 LuxR family two component transcriptional regulator [Kribbella amoyensis]